MARRILRIAVVVVAAAAFAACSNPMGPSKKLPNGIPADLVNPHGDLVNPHG